MPTVIDQPKIKSVALQHSDVFLSTGELRRALSHRVRRWFDRSFPWILLVTYAVAVCLKIPSIIREGRIWAEAGKVYLVQAAISPWHTALFYSNDGYLNLGGTVAALLGFYCLPLETAPYAGIAQSLLAQTLPVFLLVISSQPMVKQKRFQIAAALLIVAQPCTGEIWLASIHCQHFLNVAVAIILALDVENAVWKRIVQYLVLCLAPLNGLVASFMLPLFAARAMIDRSRLRAYQCLCLGTATFVQLVLFYHASSLRTMRMDVPLLLEVVCEKHILIPFFGRSNLLRLGDALAETARCHIVPQWTILISLIAISLLAAALFAARNRTATWFALAACILTPLSFIGVFGEHWPMLIVDCGNRYTFTAQVLIGLTILSISLYSRNQFVRISCAFVLAWLLSVGIIGFRDNSQWFSQGPSWRNEVRMWRANPDRPLKTWPPGWELRLPGELARTKL